MSSQKELEAADALAHLGAMCAKRGYGEIPAWVDGALTPVDKLEVHRRGLRHKAVSVFIVDGARTLIQKRAAGKYHTPGLWANACCTHPRWDEAAADCARRRLGEELGVSALAVEHVHEVEYRADVGGGLTEHEVAQIFRAEADAATLAFALNPEEAEAVRWIGVDDLAAEIAAAPARFTPWLRIYMAEHRARIFGADA